MTRRHVSLFLVSSALLGGCDMSGANTPSLAIVNARIWTGDARRPWAEAVAVRGDTIVAVGSSAEVRKLDASRVIDAAGQMVTPGHQTWQGRQIGRRRGAEGTLNADAI